MEFKFHKNNKHQVLNHIKTNFLHKYQKDIDYLIRKNGELHINNFKSLQFVSNNIKENILI